MNVAKTTYRAALVAAALSCLTFALPAHADRDDHRRPYYSRGDHGWSRDHDRRWAPPGHRWRGGYDRGYRHGYRDGRWADDRRWDRRWDRGWDGRWNDGWRYRDRRGYWYDDRDCDRGWYGSSYSRYPRYRDYDGDVELRIRIPF